MDINDNDWFAKGVYNAKKANLIDGAMADVYFYPNSEILREECASMISRHLNLAPSPEANELIALFEDGTDVSDWAKQDVIKLCYTGILKGDNKRLNPKSMITRAEAVVLLDRMIEIKGN
ncbi:MAG: S-layer homology domain-containing protein [Oscillospiraceae bacterium]